MVAGKIAGYVFTVIIPVVVAAMLPHIGPEIGFPIILVSVVIGLCDFAYVYAKSHHRKPNMLLIAGMALGALTLGGCAIAFFLSPGKQSAAQNTAQEKAKPSAYILADCYMSAYPTERPQNGEMYALIVPPNAAEILTIAVVPWVQPSRATFENLYKCDLAVKGDLPIFNVTVTFKFVVREFFPDKGTSGKTLATKEMAIFVRKIDVYPASFSVYMEDRAGYWTLVEPVTAYSKAGPADAAVFIDVKNPTKMPLGPIPREAPGNQRRPFYSARDKENLNDLCRDLSGFLRHNGGDGGGDGVWKHIATLANDWTAARNSDPQNVDPLLRELVSVRESIQLYSDGLYGDGSFFKKYDTYREELEEFFGKNYRSEIGNLQLAVGELATSIVALEAEKNPESRERLFRALEPSHQKYEQTIAQFQKHMHEITQHVEEFRKQL